MTTKRQQKIVSHLKRLGVPSFTAERISLGDPPPNRISEAIKYSIGEALPELLEYLDQFPEDILIDALLKYPEQLSNTSNIPLHVITEVIRTNGMLLAHLLERPPNIEAVAVQQNGLAIQFIEQPSERIQKLAVQQNPKAMKHIKNPILEILCEKNEERT